MLFISIFVLELINIIKMKKQRIILVTAYLLILSVVFGLKYLEKQTGIFKSINPLFLLALIIIAFVFTLQSLKRKGKKKNGIPIDDEFSLLIKYKIGYYSFLGSSFLWYLLFILKDDFPDTETILGGGILLSTLIVIVTRIIIKRFPNEQ
jgi:hypothetical protein